MTTSSTPTPASLGVVTPEPPADTTPPLAPTVVTTGATAAAPPATPATTPATGQPPTAADTPSPATTPNAAQAAAAAQEATAKVAQETLPVIRNAFSWLFFGTLIIIALLIVFTAIMMMVVAAGSAPGLDKSLIARLLQITFGMVVGSACLFLGVILNTSPPKGN